MINILVNDKNIVLWSQLAYFLDQPEFIQRVTEIRKCWNIDSTKFISLKDYSDWYKEPHYDFSLSELSSEYYTNFLDRLQFEESRGYGDKIEDKALIKKWSELNPLDLEIELLAKSTGINPYCKNLLTKAIVCNSVEKKDTYDIAEYNYGFILSDKDFDKVVAKVYKGRPKQEIIRDRRFYFANKEEGKSQNKIAEAEGLSRETVKEALKRYRKFLQS